MALKIKTWNVSVLILVMLAATLFELSPVVRKKRHSGDRVSFLRFGVLHVK